MKNQDLKWKILSRKSTKSIKGSESVKRIINTLLENRKIKTQKEKKGFLKPPPVEKISLKQVGINSKEITNAIKRINSAMKKKEQIIIYGDYDADGICATAILWECLYPYTKKVMPHIPDRFSEGYGLSVNSVKQFATHHSPPTLIITVDNGIIAHDAVNAANKLGIDVIVTDHHQKGRKLPKAHAIVHTTKLSGAGIVWFLAREIMRCHPERGKRAEGSKTKNRDSSLSARGGQALRMTKSQIPKRVRNDKQNKGLELAAIGTIADQVPLLGPNRSIAKFGLEKLNKTKRPGLIELFREAGLRKGLTLVNKLGTYEVGFVIAPRINAMGRLAHGIESLRLMCTKNKKQAAELARLLGKTNKERQKIVDEVVAHAKEKVKKHDWQGVIVLSHESYHEGVVGLAASKLVEEFYRPAIVFSKGESHSKASARSISGFNIIEAIRKVEHLTLSVGGHPMAAGLSLKTKMLKTFQEELDKVSMPLLSNEVLQKRIKIDLELQFNQINWKLTDQLKKFEPCGIGNPHPSFATKSVTVLDTRPVGREAKHLKLKLEKEGVVFDAIGFGMGKHYLQLLSQKSIDIVYTIEENIWRGRKSLQLKIKDIKVMTRF